MDAPSVRPQFLNAKVPVADSSKEEGLMILDILFRPEKKQKTKRGDAYNAFESLMAVISVTFTLHTALNRH